MIDLREIKKKILKKENFYFLTIIFCIFGIDRYSKIEIINNFNDTKIYLNDFLNIDLTWNIGIGFGLLSATSNFYYNSVSLIIITVILILIYYLLISQILDKIIFSIIIGGALGNFYDRLAYKAVPDFIDLHYNNFHWFTFNFADIFITIGVILYISNDLIIKKNE